MADWTDLSDDELRARLKQRVGSPMLDDIDGLVTDRDEQDAANVITRLLA